jgi:hypothetical protein
MKNQQNSPGLKGNSKSNRAFVSVKDAAGHRTPNASSASHANQERKPNQGDDDNELTKVDGKKEG